MDNASKRKQSNIQGNIRLFQIRQTIAVRNGDRRKLVLGIGRELENSEQNLRVLKAGVNIDEMENVRQAQKKGEAEDYLRVLCKKIDLNNQSEDRLGLKQVNLVFK